MEKTRTSKVIRATILLTVSALLMRGAGVWFNAMLEDRAGAAGVGLFSLLMSVFSLALTFGTAGLRLSSMRLSAEEKNPRRRGGGMHMCFYLAAILGVFATILLYSTAEICAEYWLGDIRAAASLRILALSIPASAISAALNGYCIAAGAALPFAMIQLAEQGIGIALTLFSLKSIDRGGGLLGLMGDNSELVCAAMALGMSGAEWLSMIASIVLYIYWGKKAKTPSFPEEKPTSLSALSRIALPDGLGAAARSVLLTAEHLLIPRGLRKSGENSQTALATYGTIHGMTLPLLLYPSALLSSLTGLIIPELARLRTEGKNLRIGGVSSRLIHWTLVFGLGTAACFYAFAPQLSAAIYGDFITVDSIRLLAPLIPAMFLDMCVDGILKGLDEQKSVMSYNVLDSALCVLMVLFLLPPMGVKGYYLILYAAELLNLTLSAARLLKVSDASVNIWESGVKSLLCAGAAWVIVQLLFAKTAAAMPAVMSAILLVSFMALIYMALINFFTRKGEKFADLVGIR